MTPYFERLREELATATERHYGAGAAESRRQSDGTRRVSRGGIRRGPVALAVIGVLAAASAAAATVRLLGEPHGLTGTVPPAALRSVPGRRSAAPGSAGGALAGLRYAVAVTPDIEPGQAGWCGSPLYTPARSRAELQGGSACATAVSGGSEGVAGGEPLANLASGSVAGEAGSHAASARSLLNREMRRRLDGREAAAQLEWFVFAPPASAVRIGAETYPLSPNPDLPSGWRALVLFASGSGPDSVVALDGRGRPLVPSPVGAIEHVQALLGAIPIRHVDPRHPGDSGCRLGPSRLAGATAEWEAVAQSAPTLGGQVPAGTLFSCARAWYALSGPHAVYSAALLLDAQDPARRAPELAGLSPASAPGEFEMDAATGRRFSARRTGNGWLVVEGPDARVRHELLGKVAAGGVS